MIKNFFEPNSVALIGASNNREKIGYKIMSNLQLFTGKLYPINPTEKAILGFQTYSSVLKIKENIDLAIIAVSPKIVPKVLIECGKKKIRAVVIITAGYSEAGNKKEEDKLLNIAKKYKIRLLGPNCFGVVNTYLKLDTTFARTTPERGNIAFVSQSGALWAAIADWSKGKYKFSKFASLGNMSDVEFAEIVDYLSKDQETKVIVLYIETLKQGKQLMEVAKKSKKPIIAIKAGSSKSGEKAALSHTGSLASEYKIYKAAFKQAGIKLVSTITEAFDKADLLQTQNIKGNKVVIITNGGGNGVLTADQCEKNNLEVVQLPNRIITKLKSLPKTWSKNNPIDLVGDADAGRYKLVLDALKSEKFYDSIIIILLELAADVEQVTDEIIKFKEETDKTVVCNFIGGRNIQNAMEKLHENGIPSFYEPERVARTLS
jgi:acetyl coenzyme A synthetase (ADP forming)-like protein